MSAGTRPPSSTRETGDGAFVRRPSAFRDWVSADGSSGFPAEPGRYHIYVSLACPWSHRTVIVRRLKRLEDAVSMSLVDPVRDERGWRFGPEYPDPVNGWELLSEAYAATDPAFDGRVSVPVLWDRERERIVNTESADIIRMLNSEFDAFGDASVDLDPAELRAEMDALNRTVYENVNDGVYRAGFATRQDAHDVAVTDVFMTLDALEERLSQRRFLMGDRVTLADWRLFTTLVRFDAVYVGHFKCNLRRLVDFPSLWPYTRELYQWPGIAETVDFDQIKDHYYISHASLNPSRIVPRGPEIDFWAPHRRERLPPRAEAEL